MTAGAPAGAMAGLRELARLHGVQTAYRGNDGRVRRAAADSLRAVLAALGVPAATPAELADSLAAARAAPWQDLCPPVVVAWDGRGGRLDLRVPAGAEGPVRCHLREEGGGTRTWEAPSLAHLPAVAAAPDGRRLLRRLPLPAGLPLGRHALRIEAAGQAASVQVLAAPRRAPDPARRGWGVFLPLYALRSPGGWGTGSFADLAELAAFVAAAGGDLVGTLPLHPTFPGEPSPYAPVSRLFWSELHLDLPSLPEFSPDMLDPDGAAELERLRAAPRLDHRAASALRRRVIGAMAGAMSGRRLAELERWADGRPEAREYARFRAYGEATPEPWPRWPAEARQGRLPPGSWDPAAERAHLYAQWAAAGQLAAVPRLYLDMPLGVHPWGYDTWRHAGAFADGASMGAPPDALFAGGQNWGMPPPHPARARADGYRYFAACLRVAAAHAAALRLDHVMGLHRLFWIPRGGSAADGVYVRYASEELYAVVTLEAARRGTVVVGEDLGTVPAAVRAAMRRHGLRRMHVLPFALGGPVPADALACLDTHDMPPFAAWWGTLSGGERALAAGSRSGSGGPPPDAAAGLAACLDRLAASPAELVLVNLEDLWLETEPQNRPGTGDEAGNWTRPARHGLPELTRLPEVVSALRRLDALRR